MSLQQQEDQLLSAFRLMDVDERSLLLSISAEWVEGRSATNHLKLVASSTGLGRLNVVLPRSSLHRLK